MMAFTKVLLLEDDRNLSLTLGVALKRLGLEVKSAATLKKAREILESFEPDLVLLDRMVPDGDGLDLCVELRAEARPVAILMLSAAAETRERVKGLNEGADDYLAKPLPGKSSRPGSGRWVAGTMPTPAISHRPRILRGNSMSRGSGSAGIAAGSSSHRLNSSSSPTWSVQEVRS